jgi:hypothetical protein
MREVVEGELRVDRLIKAFSGAAKTPPSEPRDLLDQPADQCVFAGQQFFEDCEIVSERFAGLRHAIILQQRIDAV